MGAWGGDEKEKGQSSKNKCPFCGRSFCHMLSGGRPCFEASRAAKLLAAEKKSEKEKDGSSQKKGGGEAKGGASSEGEQ